MIQVVFLVVGAERAAEMELPRRLRAGRSPERVPTGLTGEAAWGWSSELAGVGPKKRQRALPGGQ